MVVDYIDSTNQSIQKILRSQSNIVRTFRELTRTDIKVVAKTRYQIGLYKKSEKPPSDESLFSDTCNGL